MKVLKQTLFLLSIRGKGHAALLVVLIFVGALLETVGIGAFFPFVALINDPTMIYSSPHLNKLYVVTRARSPGDFHVVLGGAMIALVIFKGVYATFVNYIQAGFLAGRQQDIENRLLNGYMSSPYRFFLTTSPVELSHRVRSGRVIIESFLLPLLLVVSETFVLIVATTMLFIQEPIITGILLVGFGGFVGVLYALIKGRNRLIGRHLNEHATQMSKWLDHSFNGIKEIKIRGCQKFFMESFFIHSDAFSKCTRESQIISAIPRISLETITAVGMILSVLFFVVREKNLQSVLPIVALFALAAFRLMPSVNRIITGLITALQHKPRVDQAYQDLINLEQNDSSMNVMSELVVKNGTSWKLERGIEFRKVSYRYSDDRALSLINVSFYIQKGQAVAFVGPSGAGKTTAIDLLLGLLPVQGGQIFIDSHPINKILLNWQRQIGYVPQFIYLLDDSIRRNIAFGLQDSDIDDDLIWLALKIAQLDAFVKTLKDGLQTEVGDRGIRFSGGQRQRIGIARALYFKPKVLVMDEATSALDNDTERAIVSAINDLKGRITLIIIAHRLTTVAHCDQLYFFREGNLASQGKFEELMLLDEFKKFASACTISV